MTNGDVDKQLGPYQTNSEGMGRRGLLKGLIALAAVPAIDKYLPKKSAHRIEKFELEVQVEDWQNTVGRIHEGLNGPKNSEFGFGIIDAFEAKLSGEGDNTLFFADNVIIFLDLGGEVVAMRKPPLYGIRQDPNKDNRVLYYDDLDIFPGGTCKEFSMLYPDGSGDWQVFNIYGGSGVGYPTQPGTKLVGIATTPGKEVAVRRSVIDPSTYEIPYAQYYKNMKQAAKAELLGEKLDLVPLWYLHDNIGYTS